MSKYDSIETARDLIREVISNGLSTEQDDRNRAADILGRSQVGQLAQLANSDERICDKRIGEMFYFIAFNIWNWREAMSFYNEHTVKLNELKRERDALLKDRETAWARVNELQDDASKYAGDIYQLNDAKEKQAQEITTLKAKLYDLMTAGA